MRNRGQGLDWLARDRVDTWVFPSCFSICLLQGAEARHQVLASGVSTQRSKRILVTITGGTEPVGAIGLCSVGVISEDIEAVLRLRAGNSAGSWSSRPRGNFFLEDTCFPRAVWQEGQFLKAWGCLSYLCKDEVILGTEHQNHFGSSPPPAFLRGLASLLYNWVGLQAQRREGLAMQSHSFGTTEPGLHLRLARLDGTAHVSFCSSVVFRAQTAANRPRF